MHTSGNKHKKFVNKNNKLKSMKKKNLNILPIFASPFAKKDTNHDIYYINYNKIAGLETYPGKFNILINENKNFPPIKKKPFMHINTANLENRKMNMGYDKFIKGKDNLGHYNLDYQIFDDDYEKKNIINDNNKKKNKNESIGNDVDILDFENDSFNNLYNANNKNNNINNFTDEENEIINKLKKLGNFTDEEVKQAYLICDKNEELTANYIFEHMNNKNNINRINIIDNDD